MRKSLLTLVLAIILWMWPKSTSNKSKINKSDYIKLKAFCKVKEMTLKMKRQSMEQENKIFANSASDKAWISKMYKELIQLNSKNTIIIIWLKSRQRSWIDIFQRRYANGLQVHEKTLNITCHQGNPNQNHHEISHYIVRMAIIKNTRGNNCWQGCGKKGNPCTMLMGM